MLPDWIVLDELIAGWLREDIGRGDQATQGLGKMVSGIGQAYWVAKEAGAIAGLTIAGRVFHLLEPQTDFCALVEEGAWVEPGTRIAKVSCRLSTLLTGERVALNLAMRLSGIASLTRCFADEIADLPVQLVDTRKTTPGTKDIGEACSFCGWGAESSDGAR